jgi:hypothetical protein
VSQAIHRAATEAGTWIAISYFGISLRDRETFKIAHDHREHRLAANEAPDAIQ